jgi:hypothetical protein
MVEYELDLLELGWQVADHLVWGDVLWLSDAEFAGWFG